MMRDLGLTYTQAVVGLSTYVFAYALTPLFTSAFSEEFGRQPLYVVSVVVFLLMHVMIAL
jgi:predicted MFS family arabinose efflux permease